MQISEAIKRLQDIQVQFGNTYIVGGLMYDGVPLKRIAVVDNEGSEIWPEDKTNLSIPNEIEGVMLT
jgi:hypothetical protein